MKWNGIENEMERKFWFAIKKTPEWNGTNRGTLVVFYCADSVRIAS